MRTKAGLRIFGAGIASSAGESVYCLDSAQPLRVAFDTDRVMRTNYIIDHFQDIYFVLSGYDDLPELSPEQLTAHVATAQRESELAPKQTLPGETLIPSAGS